MVCGADLNNEADALKFCRSGSDWSKQLTSLGAESVEYVLETEIGHEVGKRFFDQ